ncbi:MAG: hypothetical protein LBK69_04325, partial [Syntrophomonadaceae bacterium]|nr:hypothetical protein [Syntrophomonadaceae bacterium]
MNLELIYKDGETGKKLASALQINYTVKIKDNYSLNDEKYLKILIHKDDSSSGVKMINSAQAIKNSLAPKVCSDILTLNNIACANEDEILKKYEITMVGFDCINIKVFSNEKGKKKTYYAQEKDNKKVVSIAGKAIYVLGLDLGMAEIAFTKKRVYKVRRVEPSPEIEPEFIEKIISKLEAMSELDSNSSQEVFMGADPEFMLLNSKNGKMIPASDHFPREGLVGCDNIRVPNRQQRPVAEVRPKPSNSPYELVKNIHGALLSAQKLAPYKNVKWIAGSLPTGNYSIGGHIHFSQIQFNASVIRAFDNYLAIPVFLIENPVSAAKRRKKNGTLGDYRLKEYGFEYRTLSSWLVSPQVASAVLCLAKIVASRYYLLNNNFFSHLETHQAFYQGEQEYFYNIFSQLWLTLEQIDLYKLYKDDLEIIKNMVTEKKHWDENADFRLAWQIPE